MPNKFTGVSIASLDRSTIETLYAEKKIVLDYFPDSADYAQNEYLVIKDGESESSSALGRVKESYVHLLNQKFLDKATAIKPRNKEQYFALDALIDDSVRVATLTGKPGSGKTLLSIAAAVAKMEQGKYKKIILTKPSSQVGKRELGILPGPQPIDAKIPTPNGWVLMGDLNVGSTVFDSHGAPCEVLGVFPKGEKETFRVTTSDGTSTECCIDHLWYTQNASESKHKKAGKVRSTREIFETLKRPDGRANHFLPRNGPVQFSKQLLPLSPYTLGAWLGNGSSAHSGAVSISFPSLDMVRKIQKENSTCNFLPAKQDGTYYFTNDLYNNKPAKPVQIINIATGESTRYESIGLAIKATGYTRNFLNDYCNQNKTAEGYSFSFLPCPVRWSNSVKDALTTLGLGGVKSPVKFIPDCYKYSSIDDRLELLRGLMDTDGTIKLNGEASFSTTSENLAHGVVEIVRSLGGRATPRQRPARKMSKIQGRYIKTRPSYEFTVSMPHELNPFFRENKAKYHSVKSINLIKIIDIEPIGKKQVQCIQVKNSENLYLTDNFLVTHNTLEEKFMPFLINYMCNFEVIFGESLQKATSKVNIEYIFSKYNIEIVPMQLLRGASFNNALVIADEVQILDHHEMLTLGTRISEGSKLVIMGDLNQRDEKIAEHHTGMHKFIHDMRSKASCITAFVHMLKSERGEVCALFSDIFESE